MATVKNEVIEIKPIKLEKFQIRLVGDTPLIAHAWDEKAKDMIKDPKKGKIKEPRNPMNSFIQSMYWLNNKPVTDAYTPQEECERLFEEAITNGARFGFPVTAFKQAGNAAAYRMGWVKNQMGLRGSYFVDAEQDGLVEIKGSLPVLREDMVKVGMGTTDIRWRGEFRDWYVDLTVSFNKSGQYTKETIINVINAGGFVCGVGEWRPERDGQYGMYHVETI